MTGSTVYITIGNSDDKLSQAGWAAFLADVTAAVVLARLNGAVVHFAGVSFPDAPWQNAQWCVQVPDEGVREALRIRMRELAGRYLQDSVAWAEVDQVNLLTPLPHPAEAAP